MDAFQGIRKKRSGAYQRCEVPKKSEPEDAAAFLKYQEERHIHYNETLEELASLEKEGRIHIIRPSSPIQAAMIERDESNLERIYQTGRADMKKDLEKLKAYLDS